MHDEEALHALVAGLSCFDAGYYMQNHALYACNLKHTNQKKAFSGRDGKQNPRCKNARRNKVVINTVSDFDYNSLTFAFLETGNHFFLSFQAAKVYTEIYLGFLPS